MKNVFDTHEYIIFTIGDIQFGVHTGQVTKIIPFDRAKQEKIKVCWFHQMIFFSKKQILYQSPMALLVKDSQKYMGIVIDEPENILKISRNDIRPLPEFIRQYTGTAPIESVALKDDTMILLMDINRLQEQKNRQK